MLQHFQIQSLYEDKRLPGWTFSFYFHQQKIAGIYYSDGKIEWTSKAPDEPDNSALQKQVHDLMIFHIYDQQR